MNDNLTEIVFILDRSGSMAGLEADTIGGFNAMLEKQKQEPGEALLSTVLFSDRSQVLYFDPAQSTDLTPAARKAMNIPEGRTMESLQAELAAQAQGQQQ